VNKSGQLFTIILGIIIVSLLALLVEVAYVRFFKPYQTSDSTAVPAQQPTATPTIPEFPPLGLDPDTLEELLFPQVDFEISIDTNGFSPTSITASVNQRVKWVNNDESEHSLEFQGNTQPLSPDGEYSILLETAGTFEFTVSGFENTTGIIEVTEVTNE